MADFLIQLRGLMLRFAMIIFALLFFAALYMDAWLIEKLNAKKWTIPAVVYARPLEVYEGLAISQQALVRELKAAGYKNSASNQWGTYDVTASNVNVRLREFDFLDGRQAAQTLRVGFAGNRVSSFRSSVGNAYGARLEPMEIGRIHTETQENRLLVSLDEVPQSLIDALIITEDRYFFSHHGISVRGIFRALFANAKEGKVVEGASTLTQQLIKNFLLESSKSYSRKLLEAILAILLELHVDKNTILEAYINEVFVAQNGSKAVHGFGLASQYLFGLPLSSLSVEQTALLVAMMKGPSYYNPLRYPERAIERRNLVISLLTKEGKISSEEAQLAANNPLGLLDREEMLASYPAYLDLVRRQLRRDYSGESLALDGLRIFTAMDPQWQWRAQRELVEGVKHLEQRYGAKAKGIDGAVVVTDNATGDVLAVVGSKMSRVSGFNRALDARRPIGSLIKPAIYLTALQAGYTLTSTISDEPLSIKTPQGMWKPQNYDKAFHGDVPLYLALAKSYNVPAVRLGLSLGVSQVSKTLQKLGVEEAVPQLPSMLLGAVDLSPFNVAQVYSTIANKGFYTPLKTIQDITDANGNPVKRYNFRIEQRFSADAMHLLDFALRKVVCEGTASSVSGRFVNKPAMAGKTGTTNDLRDSWFAGYDSNKMVVVWLGHDDNAPLPVTGGSGALPIWADIIAPNTASEGASNVPVNIHSLWIDKETGYLSAEKCKGAIVIPYIDGTAPVEQVDCAKTNKVMNWLEKWFQ
jgi:penicillin-binding protein 1B